MLRRGLTYALGLLVALTLFGGGLVSSLALVAPFHPGDPLYELQSWVEQTRLALVNDQVELAQRLLDLVERRLDDLEARLGSEYEVAAYTAVEAAIRQAVQAISAAPAEARGQLKLRLASLAVRLQNLLARMTVLPKTQPDLYARARDNARLIIGIAGGEAGSGAAADGLPVLAAAGNDLFVAAVPTGTPVYISPHGVPFPPHATPGAHDTFVLTGGHTTIACVNCHTQATYRGTAKECAACHADVMPANHYPGKCDQCHATPAWKPATFSHTGFTDCVSCHTPQKPANHYPGQCGQCHTPNAWKPATFNHAGFTDCQSCHLNKKPANHYDGQCGQCHTTNAWKPATFNHTGFTDCQSCHLNKKPANHYDGQCSQCHSTSVWKPATFNHAGFTDCQSCHLNKKPANHYDGQCSLCHATSAWKPATFNHSTIGNADCAQCHRPPANHYAGACRSCHGDTGNWRNATFDHSSIGGADCSQCHQPPANHFPGACRDCHSDTGNWRNASFNHTFPIDHRDANGQCAKCHPGNNYGSWTCAECHSQTKMDDKHKEINGYTWNCLACHADGRKP